MGPWTDSAGRYKAGWVGGYKKERVNAATHQHLQGPGWLLAAGSAHHRPVRTAVVVHALPHALHEERPLLPRVLGVGVVPVVGARVQGAGGAANVINKFLQRGFTAR